MSIAAFQHILEDFESWSPGGPYEDVLCLRAFSKDVHGQITRERQDVQECQALDCSSVKSYFVGTADAVSGPCDDVPELDGSWNDLEAVRAGMGTTPDGRAGNTGRFVWASTAGTVNVRFYGMARVGTHRPPFFADCEECHVPLHWEGWLRGAVVDGEHEGCRIWASYAFNVDPAGAEGTASISGAVEGLLACQCDPNAD